MRIALLINSANVYGREIVRGVAAYARNRPDWEFFGERSGFLQPVMGMDHWKGDGAIVLADAQRMRQLRRRRMPAVNVSAICEQRPLPSVLPDNREIGRLAARALLDDGFRRFAFAGFHGHFYAQQRMAGFREVVEKAGLKVRLPDYKPTGSEWWDGSPSERKALGQWLKRQEFPLGLLAACDQRAVQVIKAAQAAGLQVPEQVAVIGVDNDEMGCDLTRPRLSSVDPNARQVGYRAAELLESLIAGQDSPQEPIRVPPLGLVRRASSDILAVEDRDVARALEFIRDSVETPTTVDDVLDRVGVSRSSLERKFHRQIGRTPLQEIRRVHLQAVRQLLIETQLPMSEIARRCGFSSPERLATVFGQQEGTTPTEFRRRFQHEG